MTSPSASKVNAAARSAALSVLAREHRLAYMVYVVAHTQAGSSHPRNAARSDLAALHPERYDVLYAAAKLRALARAGLPRPIAVSF